MNDTETRLAALEERVAKLEERLATLETTVARGYELIEPEIHVDAKD